MQIFAYTQYEEYFQGILLFGMLSSLLLWMAKSKGYFVLPHTPEKKNAAVQFKSVVIVFAIYLGMTVLVAPVAIHLIKSTYALFSHGHPPIAVLGWVQLLTLFAIFLLFYLYSRTQGPQFFSKIWKDRSIPHPAP